MVVSEISIKRRLAHIKILLRRLERECASLPINRLTYKKGDELRDLSFELNEKVDSVRRVLKDFNS